MRADNSLLVLDAHGVVFSGPWRQFLRDTAVDHGLDPAVVMEEWATSLRRPFWLGQLGEAALWTTLFPGCRPGALSAELEQRYAEGPLFRALIEIPDPIWILSNHRSHWLHDRISRFGLEGRFETVLVSDAIGYVKPERGAFETVRGLADGRTIRYVDDTPANIEAARSVFDVAMHVAEFTTVAQAGRD